MTPRTWNLNDDLLCDLSSQGGAGLRLLLDLVARASLWVDPRVAAAVGVAYPKTRRLVVGREFQGEVKDGLRLFTNQPPIHAFFHALGSHERWFEGCSVCHIHGEGVHDPRHYTRLANLTCLPATLSRFSDWEPVAAALQYRAFELYGYRGPRGRRPRRPAAYPRSWAPPTVPPNLERTLSRMTRARDQNPMYLQMLAPRPAPAPSIMPRHAPARDLDREFWDEALSLPSTRAALVGWLVRHAYFAPVEVVRQVPLPFPRARRVLPDSAERKGEKKGGVWLVDNTPAARALFAAIGRPLTGNTRGGNVDHAWPQAPYLSAHYSRLAGLVLVPLAMASFVDAPPIRALLQRHIFERTGYRGPAGKTPAPSPLKPAAWPELGTLSPPKLAHAVRLLSKWRATRPGFVPGSDPRKRP